MRGRFKRDVINRPDDKSSFVDVMGASQFTTRPREHAHVESEFDSYDSTSAQKNSRIVFNPLKGLFKFQPVSVKLSVILVLSRAV